MSEEKLEQPRDLRVVVVGGNQSGKTSLVNAILDQKERDPIRQTASCVKREGEFKGRHLICIDTPGWWRNYPLSDTADFMKQELVLSVTKCPPGPHAFLLAISTEVLFTEKHRRSVEEHLGLFGEKVWEHTIVVFTRGDKSIEQHIDSEGEPLKWILDKCSNRYHILENESSTDDVCKITQLLEKIDSVKSHLGFFLPDKNTQKECEERRELQRENAESRRKKVKIQRQTLSKHAQVLSLSEFRILLLGWVSSGKTSAKNIILNIKGIVGGRRTMQIEIHSGEVAGKQVMVVDTPGWWKYFPAKYTPEWVKAMLRESVTLDGRNPHAILLVIPADTTFKEEQRKITEDNMKMFGEQVWRHTMVLFTSGDLLGETKIEEHIESEAPLQWLLEKCENRYHVLGWDESDKSSQVTELLEKIKEMVAGNSLFSLHEETQAPNIAKRTMDTTDTTHSDMVKFLDDEWKRMDKDMEENIINICNETFKSQGDRSLDHFTDFHQDDSPSDTSTGESLLRRPTSALSKHQTVSETRGDVAFSGKAEDNGHQTSCRSSSEDIKETLEREWGRREVTVMARFQRILSDLMEQNVSSDAGVHALDHSFRKVMWWFHHGTSGIGSLENSDLEETN